MFWGVTSRTMLRDEAHAFLQAGAAIESADMVLRMLRVALPLGGEGAEAYLRDGQALALLQAVGGFQAYRRSVPAPPNAGPVARFLLFERDYPDSRRVLHRGAAQRADRRRPVLPQLARRPAAVPDDRRPRLPRPRRRARQPAWPTRSATSSGSSRCRCRHRPPLLWRPVAARRAPGRRMNFAIRFLTEYRYDAPGHGQPERAAREAGDDGDPERRGLRGPGRPRVAAEPAPRLLRHDRDRVRDLAPARPHARSTSAPACATHRAGGAARELLGGVEERAYDAAAAEFLLPVGPEPDDVALDDLVGLTRGETPLATLRKLVDVIPDRFEYRAGVTYVGSTVRTCSTPAPASARTSPTSRCCCCAATGSRRAT